VILQGLRCTTQGRGFFPGVAQPDFRAVALYSQSHGVVIDVLALRSSGFGGVADSLFIKAHATERAGIRDSATPELCGALRGMAMLVLLPHLYHRVAIGKAFADRPDPGPVVFAPIDGEGEPQDTVIASPPSGQH
jgi:hypothetical protein